MLEFTFCMIVLFLMMYAIVMIFRWVGLDLGQRQQAHEDLLTTDIDPNYGDCLVFNMTTMNCDDLRPIESGPLTQIDPYFYTPDAMNAVWMGN